MKQRLLVALLLVGVLGFWSGSGCSKKEEASHPPTESQSEKKIRYYTCSMHPQVHLDHPGPCPICGMKLVPVYEEEKKEGQSSTGTVELSFEKQQLIGIKTQEVKSQPLVREIHAPGRVAYQPDLFLAQQEYLIALKTRGGERTLQTLQSRLVQSAKLRLRLLGMSEDQIQELTRKGKAQTGLLLPQTEGMNWIYGSIFESDLAWVKTGDTVEVFLPSRSESYSTEIESIDPTIDPTTRTAQIRLRLSQASGFLKPDLFLKLVIQTQTPPVLTISEEALLDTGKRFTVFLDRGEGKFEPRSVKIGRRGTGFVEILSGLSAGDRVVTSANFLLDAESKLKAGPVEGDHFHD